MKKQVVNHRTYDSGDKSNYETPRGKSMTIPDETLGLKELVKRYTRGLPVSGKQPIYQDEEFQKTEELTFDHEYPFEVDKLSRIELSEMSFDVRRGVKAAYNKLQKKLAEAESDEEIVLTDLPLNFVKGVAKWYKEQEDQESGGDSQGKPK